MSDTIVKNITSMVTLNCLCESNNYNHIGWKDGREVVKCIDCDLWYVKAIPDNYTDMYKNGWYHTQCQRQTGHQPYYERFWHDYDLALTRIQKISGFRMPGQSLLDVGCSNGAFVRAARTCRYRAWGIDICEKTDEIQWCTTAGIFDLLDYPWNIVTMHDVLEHYIDPMAAIEQIGLICAKNALFVLEGPDFGCAEAKEQGIEWKHVRPIEHIYMMPAMKICDMLEFAGFSILELQYPIPGHYAIYAEKT